MHQLSLLLSFLAAAALSNAQDSPGTTPCPGVAYSDDTTSACCVGGTLASIALSDCEGWPICQGPVTTTASITPLSCATLIPFTDPSYMAEISSASESLEASGTRFCTTVGMDGNACETTTGTAAGESTSATTTMSGGDATTTTETSSGTGSTATMTSTMSAATASATGNSGVANVWDGWALAFGFVGPILCFAL